MSEEEEEDAAELFNSLREDAVLSGGHRKWLKPPDYCNCEPACEDWKEHNAKRKEFEIDRADHEYEAYRDRELFKDKKDD